MLTSPSSATGSILSGYPLAQMSLWARLFLTSSVPLKQLITALGKLLKSGQLEDPLNPAIRTVPEKSRTLKK